MGSPTASDDAENIEMKSREPSPQLPKLPGEFVAAIKEFKKTNPDELAVTKGDKIEILEDCGNGWFRGKIAENEGKFPSKCVSLESSSARRTTQQQPPLIQQQVRLNPQNQQELGQMQEQNIEIPLTPERVAMFQQYRAFAEQYEALPAARLPQLLEFSRYERFGTQFEPVPAARLPQLLEFSRYERFGIQFEPVPALAHILEYNEYVTFRGHQEGNHQDFFTLTEGSSKTQKTTLWTLFIIMLIHLTATLLLTFLDMCGKYIRIRLSVWMNVIIFLILIALGLPWKSNEPIYYWYFALYKLYSVVGAFYIGAIVATVIMIRHPSFEDTRNTRNNSTNSTNSTNTTIIARTYRVF